MIAPKGFLWNFITMENKFIRMKKNNTSKIWISIAILLTCSLQAISQSKFPDATVTGLYNAIKSEVDPVRMEEMLKVMQNATDGPNKAMLLDVSKQIVAVAFAEQGDIIQATYWLGQINDKMWKEQASAGILSRLLETKQIGAAEAILKSIVEGSPSALFEGSKEKYFPYYGKVLYEKGKYKEALIYLAPQASLPRRGNSELYALALMKAGNATEAMTEVLKQIQNSNINNPEFMVSAKELFVKIDGNDRFSNSG
jgi:hypothetical protein